MKLFFTKLALLFSVAFALGSYAQAGESLMVFEIENDGTYDVYFKTVKYDSSDDECKRERADGISEPRTVGSEGLETLRCQRLKNAFESFNQNGACQSKKISEKDVPDSQVTIKEKVSLNLDCQCIKETSYSGTYQGESFRSANEQILDASECADEVHPEER